MDEIVRQENLKLFKAKLETCSRDIERRVLLTLIAVLEVQNGEESVELGDNDQQR